MSTLIIYSVHRSILTFADDDDGDDDDSNNNNNNNNFSSVLLRATYQLPLVSQRITLIESDVLISPTMSKISQHRPSSWKF